MTLAKVIQTVRNGALKIEVRKYADGRFGFDYNPTRDERVKVRLKTVPSAVARANELLKTSGAGRLDAMGISTQEMEEFLRWKADRPSSLKVSQLVESFIAMKASKGRSHHHLRQVSADLRQFAKAFDVPLSGLTRREVEGWIDGRKVGPRRWNNLRERLVALYRFGRREGAVGSQLCGPELIERKRVDCNVETYTAEELKRLLAVVETEWLPAVVLGAFSGLRPEEICPDPRTGKTGLVWGNILWDRKKIDVPAKVSKTRHRRFVPLLPAAIAFLQPHAKGLNESVCPDRALSNQTRRWAPLASLEWKADALRHSYASYRLALIQDLQQLSLEMGNSPGMIHRHYLDLKHEDEAKQWFAIRPKDILSVVPKVPRVPKPKTQRDQKIHPIGVRSLHITEKPDRTRLA